MDLRAIIRAPVVVHEHMPVPDVLAALKRQRVHMAIVASEYGGVDGILTLEDVVEEVFGPIYDEHDVEEESLVRQADGSLRVAGTLTIWDLEDLAEIRMTRSEDQDYETVAGLLMTAAGAIPEVGFTHVQDGWRFTVEEADATRVVQVRVSPLTLEAEPEEPTEGEAAGA